MHFRADEGVRTFLDSVAERLGANRSEVMRRMLQVAQKAGDKATAELLRSLSSQ